jgi:hypothetical protein
MKIMDKRGSSLEEKLRILLGDRRCGSEEGLPRDLLDLLLRARVSMYT